MTSRDLKLSLPDLVATAHSIYPYQKLGTFKNRLRFISTCLRHRDALTELLSQDAHAILRDELHDDPHTLGFVEWPYIHAGWPVIRRFEAISEHRKAVHGDMALLDLASNESLLVSDLSAVSPGLRLTVDRAYWLMREGGLVFNQFVGDERLMTIAFSFGWRDGELIAYVGSVQGSNTDAAVAVQKDLRRDLHRMRSRDFLVKAFQGFMHHLGIRTILCVSDRYRHHRHSYFTRDVTEKYHTDYDEVWQEHGGAPTDDGFYRLPAPAVRKPIEDIEAKNRSLYRKRYAMFDDLAADMQRRFGTRGT